MAQGDDSLDWTEWEDPRSHLVTQPVRWVRDLHPEWVALEEVPAVLGLWQHFARILRGMGYSAWTGVLMAADYGVPQTRERAILMASRVATVHPPLTGKAASGQWLLRSRRDSEGRAETSRNLSVVEAGILQSFRPDYPWQGNKGKQGQQVGNAIPPLLAAHVLAALGVGELSERVA